MRTGYGFPIKPARVSPTRLSEHCLPGLCRVAEVAQPKEKEQGGRCTYDERVSCGPGVEVDLPPPKRCPPPVLIRRSPDRAAPNPGRREQSHRVAGTATLRS